MPAFPGQNKQRSLVYDPFSRPCTFPNTRVVKCARFADLWIAVLSGSQTVSTAVVSGVFTREDTLSNCVQHCLVEDKRNPNILDFGSPDRIYSYRGLE